MNEKTLPGELEDYRGYSLHRFKMCDAEAIVVEPANPLPGRRWVWKAEFFEAFPTFELAMLERGFFLAYLNVGNTFGCPSAMDKFDKFHTLMTSEYEFATLPVLLGLSRGGLYVYNWAARNPDKVSCIYADNAVCDFKSWPGGKGEGSGSQNDWNKLIEDYGFASEQEALDYKYNPIDNLEPLAAAGIPLIHVSATEDEVVPISENTDILEARYKKLGGNIKVVRHPGKHHPHGLDDPTPVVDFILEYGL